MFRRTIAMALVFMFMFTTIISAQATAEMTVMDKMSTVEKTLYGNDQTGALLERVSKLEKDVYGTSMDGAIVSRVDNLYNGALDNSAGHPSMLTKVNGIEWAITHSVTNTAMKNRIEHLETVIEGNPKVGAYNDRISNLAALAFADGSVDVSDEIIPADTLVKIKLVTPIESKTARVGDIVTYQVAEDVVMNGVLVFAKGAEGNGKITKVSQAQNFGRDAKVDIDFSSITAIDGSEVSTFLGDKAKKETESMAIAAGATVAGLAILGPIGIVGGAFVKGKQVNIPEGTEIYIQTKEENIVHGVQSQTTFN
ncbi:hypothetical protein [Anaerosinus massiliensis]|uniref:hypothetical protein n=1 Tax=Massilibacillus massiliensis TaxID=1806837 RepID=UPI000AD042AE|nr:hypothetical protein [Massilibacillus massiliensis]